MATNKYAGTQTEKIFAPPFRANPKQETNTPISHRLRRKRVMNRCLPSSSKQPITKKSTQKCGSKNFRVSAIQAKISPMPPQAKITNGRICMQALQNCRRGGLYGTRRKIQSCGRDRKAPRGKIPCTA